MSALLLAVMIIFMSAIMISALLANNTKSVDNEEQQFNTIIQLKYLFLR